MAKGTRAESAGAIVGLAILAAITVLVAAFLPPVPTGPRYEGAGADDATPQRGGTFRAFTEADARWFDPLRTTDAVSNIGVKLVFEGLIEHDHDLALVPRLAREMPTVSDDALTYTFRLREGVLFHHGREVVAEDVRWSLEQMLRPETGSPGAPMFGLVEGIEAYSEGRAPHVSGIRVVDRYTIEIRLTRPDQTFLHAMALPAAMPVPRELYEGRADAFARSPVGAGAFAFESWEPGVRVTFRRNPSFFIEGQPYLDRIVLELNLQRGPAFMRFQSAQLDHIHRFTSTDYIWLMRQEAWRPYISSEPLVDIWGLFMNNGIAPFDDPHVRRAVAHAIDRDRWNVARANRLLPTGQPIPPALPGYDPSLPEAQHLDVALARREMALAGHPVTCSDEGEDTERCVAEGLDEVELWIGEGPTGQAYGVLAQQDLAAIGMRVRLRPVAFPLLLQQSSREGTVPFIFWGYSMDFPDTAGILEPLFHSRGATATDATNRTFYRNPEIDRLFDEARVERDPTQRTALYRQANAILAADAPWAFIFSNLKVEAWQPYVRGYRQHPVWDELYRDVWLDLPRRRIARALDRAGASSFAAVAPFGGWR